MTTQPPQQSPQTLPFMAGATDMSRPWPHSTASYLDVSHVPARNHFYNTTYNTGGVSAEYQTPATTEPWRTRNANLVGPAYVSPYPDSWQSCGERVPVSVSGNPAWQQSSPGFADYQQISPSRSDGSSSTHLSSVPSPYANQIPFIKAEEYSNSAPYNTQYSLDHGLHNQSSFAGSEHYTTDPTVPRKPFHPSMVSTAHHPEDVKYTYDSDQSYDTESLSLGSGPRMLNPDFSPRRGFATPEAATCQCDVCGKQFHRTNNLLTHKQTHDPERSHPHKCTVPDCGRGFVRKTDLVRHEQSVSSFVTR